jgi:hypothetical protein
MVLKDNKKQDSYNFIEERKENLPFSKTGRDEAFGLTSGKEFFVDAGAVTNNKQTKKLLLLRTHS